MLGIVVTLHGKETGPGDLLVLDVLAAGIPPQIELLLKSNFGLKGSIKELDILLNRIAEGVPLDIMPGLDDPATFSLPQQSLNRCLFLGSTAYNTFGSCTNPRCFELDNIIFLGTSGQNMDELQKYSEAKDQLEFMERTLRRQHLAPTALNSLGCCPFADRDPFLIESCPHVYFVGNRHKFETPWLKGSEGQSVRLICIPIFSETGVAVVKSGVSHSISVLNRTHNGSYQLLPR